MITSVVWYVLVLLNFGELNLYTIHYWHRPQSYSWIVSSYLRLTVITALLSGVSEYQPNRELSLLIVAIRLIYDRTATCYDHVNDLLMDKLHWRHVPERITFECCLVVYKSLSGLAPSCIADFSINITFIRSRTGLRSNAGDELVVPRVTSKFGDHSFSMSGPAEWNALPHIC